MLEKETAVPPLRIRLKHALELKLTRILVRVNHGNSVFERLKKEKKKKPNFDTKINYLIDTPQGDSLAGQISCLWQTVPCGDTKQSPRRTSRAQLPT